MSRLEAGPQTLYRIFDQEGRLIYVGLTQHLAQRLRRHRAAWYGDQVATVETEEFDDLRSGLDAERDAIAVERPRWNVEHKLDSLLLWNADDYRDFIHAREMSDRPTRSVIRRIGRVRADLAVSA